MMMLLLSVGILNAQLAQSGTISGTVVAEDGSVIPGVTVDVRSPAIVLEKMTSVSNEDGQFRFRNLPPGSYELTFSLEGMKTLVRKNIVVSVSGTTNLNVAMEFGTLTENVEVSGKSPTIDVQATAKTTNISATMIQSIPTRVRTLAGIFSLAPGVQNGVAHGSGERNNSWNVDGVNTNDPTVGTQGTAPASEVLQEVAVSIGGVGANQGSSGGAIVNAVTKSGGNNFSGSASVYYNHESFNGDNTKGTVLEGSASGDKFSFNPSVSIGGPVIKNKVWFFGSYNLLNSETYVQGYPADQDTEIPLDRKEPYIYGKLTFQPGANDKFYVSYAYSDLIRNHRGASDIELESSTWKQNSTNHNFNVDWTHNFSSSFFGNLKFASAPVNFDLLSKNGNSYMQEYTTDEVLPGSGYGFSDYNTRSRLQFQTDFTLFIDDFVGQHEWKAGADYTLASGERHFQPGGAESSQQAGYHPYFIQYYRGSPYYAYFYNDHTEQDKMNLLSVYLQDTWSPTRKLTLTLGLRFENSRGIIPEQNQQSTGYFLPEFFGTDYPLTNAVTEEFTALTWNNIAPRLAMSYDFAGDGKTVMKASYGRYYEAMIGQYFSTTNPNGFAYFYGPYDKDTNTVSDIWGFDLPRAGTLGYKGKDPTAPYEDQFTVSIERELFEDWSLTLRGIYKEKKNILEDVDMSGLDIDALMDDGELVWTNWRQVPVTDSMTGSTISFWEKINGLIPSDVALVNIPGQSREYMAMEVVLKKRFAKGWMMEASYILSKLEGLFNTSFNATTGITNYYNTPNAHVNAYGRLENDRRHMFKLLAMAKGPWGINLNGIVQFQSGNPYSRLLDQNQLGLALNGVTGTSIIASSRGEYVLPDQFNVDLSLEKEFKIQNFRMTFFVNAFNLFNSGVASSVEATTSHSLRPFGTMRSITAPFYLRVGARFDFN
jgi:outer membrane receptor protein involved in Fe transport